MNPLRRLAESGQAVWLDFIHRDLLESGELERLISEDGVTGVTSNPAIFEGAITGGASYDASIEQLLEAHPEISTVEIYERLAVADVRDAADLLLPVWKATDGRDGFVSLEVSPHLADDTEATIAEARRLWGLVERPNLMIKVPATAEGVPAVEELLADGVNVNITLMFSLGHYESVARAYLQALARAARVEHLASVASFFVSRVDSRLDPRLEALADPRAAELVGWIGIANSRLAYRRYREVFEGAQFEEQRRRGAAPQRLLWASTSTKNPDYRDVLYVEELIGPDTVNTMPPATLDAFRDHGRVDSTLTADVTEAERRIATLAELGIDLAAETEALQREGIEKFARPFDRLLAALEEKRRTVQGRLTAAE